MKAKKAITMNRLEPILVQKQPKPLNKAGDTRGTADFGKYGFKKGQSGMSNSAQYFPLISVQYFPLCRFFESDFYAV